MEISKGEKAYGAAFAITVCLSAAITVGIVADTAATTNAINPQSAMTTRTVLAGAAGGFLALFAARGWMGGSGVLGNLRALVGSTVVALIASAVAGILIMPFSGLFYGPVATASAFTANPWLAVAWYGVLLAVHVLMTRLTDELSDRDAQLRGERFAISELSPLTRAQLYNRD